MEEKESSLTQMINNFNTYKKLPVSEREAHSVRELCLTNFIAAVFYLQTLDKASAKFILDSLVTHNPPFIAQKQDFTITTTVFRWFIKCVAETFDLEIDIDEALLVLSSVKGTSQIYSPIFDFLQNESVDANTVASALARIFTTNKPVFYVLKPRFTEMIKGFDKSLAIQHMGYDSLNFLDQSVFEITDFQLNENSDAYSLFEQYSIYIDPSFIQRAQKEYFKQHYFPEVTFFGGHSRLASLFNTAASQNVSIIDLTLGASIKYFESDDSQKAMDYLGLFPDMKSLGIIAVLHKKYTDYNWIKQNISALKKFPKNIFGSFLERVQNDLQLLDKIKQVTGQSHPLKYLSTDSLPKMLQMTLESFDGDIFEDIRNKEFFAISDEERDSGFDFVCAYFAIGTTLRLIEEQNNDFYIIIDSSLRNISNIDLQQSVALDIFSLMFLQHEGKMLFTPMIAEHMIPILLGIINSREVSEHLRQAHKRVLLSTLLDPESTMETSLVSLKTLFHSALIKEDWQISEQVACTIPELMPFYEIFKSNATGEVVNGNQHKDILAVENTVCHNNSEEISQVIEMDSVSENIKHILNSRIDKHPLEIFPDTEPVKELESKLVRLTSVSWPTTDVSDLIDCEKLKSFFAYLDTLVPSLLTAHPDKTVGEVMIYAPDKIVSNLLLSGYYNEAKKVAALMNMDITEAILTYMPNDVEAAAPYLRQYPVVHIASALTCNKTPSMVYSPTIARYIDSKSGNTVVDEEDREQDGIKESVLLEKLRMSMNKYKVDKEAIIDISYRIPEDLFKNVIIDNLQIVDLNKLFDALQYSVCDEALYQRVKILADVSKYCNPFPLKYSLSVILKNDDFQLAKEFIDEFRFEVDTVSVMREKVLDLLHEGKPVVDLLDMYPSIRKDIIISLPISYQQSITQGTEEFFDFIPKTWKVEGDPTATCKANIESDEFQNVMSRFKQIDLSNDILNIIKGKMSHSDIPFVYRLQTLSELVRRYARCFRTTFSLSKYVSKVVLTFISSISVDQPLMEDLASEVLIKSYTVINESSQIFKEIGCVESTFRDLQKHISCLRKFVSCAFSARFGLEYSFQNFTSNESGRRFAEVCAMYDEIELMNKIAETWGIEINDIRDSYAQQTIDLGLYKESLRLSVDRRDKLSLRTTSIVHKAIYRYKFCSWIDRPLIAELIAHGVPADIEIFVDEFVEQDLIGMSSIFRQVDNTNHAPKAPMRGFESFEIRSRRMMNFQSPIMNQSAEHFEIARKHSLQTSASTDFSPSADVDIVPRFYYRIYGISRNVFASSPPQDAQNALFEYLESKAPVSERVGLLVESRSFKVPIILTQEETDKQKRWNLFFNSILIPSLSFNTLNLLKSRINEFDPTHKIFAPLLVKLLEKCREMKLNRLGFDIEMFLGMTDDALNTAQELFANAETTNECIHCLDMIDRCIKNEESPNFTRLIEGVKIQRNFCSICVQNQINDCRSMNIFGATEAQFSVAAYLLTILNFDLAKDVLEYTKINQRFVAERLADILSNDDPAKVTQFFQSFEQSNFPVELFSQITQIIVMRIAYEHNNLELTSVIIKSLKNATLRCLLFIQLNDPTNAFADAKANELYDLYPFIANIAFKQGKQQIVDEAMKVLSKMAK